MEDPLKLPTDDDNHDPDPLRSASSSATDTTRTNASHQSPNRDETVIAEPIVPPSSVTTSTSSTTDTKVTSVTEINQVAATMAQSSTSSDTTKQVATSTSDTKEQQQLLLGDVKGTNNQSNYDNGGNDGQSRKNTADDVVQNQSNNESCNKESKTGNTEPEGGSAVERRRLSTKCDENMPVSLVPTSSATMSVSNVTNNLKESACTANEVNSENAFKLNQQRSTHEEIQKKEEVEESKMSKNEVLSTDNGEKRNEGNISGTNVTASTSNNDRNVDYEKAAGHLSRNFSRDEEKFDLSSSTLNPTSSSSTMATALKTNDVKSESSSIHIVPGTNDATSTSLLSAALGEVKPADSSSTTSSNSNNKQSDESKNEGEKSEEDEVSLSFLDRVIKHALKNRLAIGNFDTSKPFDINRRPGGLPAFNNTPSTSSSSATNSNNGTTDGQRSQVSSEGCDTRGSGDDRDSNPVVPVTNSSVIGSDRVSSSSNSINANNSNNLLTTSVTSTVATLNPTSKTSDQNSLNESERAMTVTSSVSAEPTSTYSTAVVTTTIRDRPSSNNNSNSPSPVVERRRTTSSSSSSIEMHRQEMIDSKYRTKEDLKHARLEASLDLSKPSSDVTAPSSSTLDLTVPVPRPPIDLPPKKASSLYMSAPDFSKSTIPSSNPLHVKPPDFEKSAMTSKQLQIPHPNFAAKLKGGSETYLPPQSPQVTQEKLAELKKKNNYISDLRIKQQEVVKIPSPSTHQPIYLEEPPLHVIHKGQYQNLKESNSEPKPEPVIVKSETTIEPNRLNQLPTGDLQSQTVSSRPTPPYKPRHKEYAPDVHLANYKGQLNVLAIPEKTPPDKLPSQQAVVPAVEQIHRTPSTTREDASKIITVPSRTQSVGARDQLNPSERLSRPEEVRTPLTPATSSFPYKIDEPKFVLNTSDPKTPAEQEEEFSFKLKERQLRQEGTIITVKPDPAKLPPPPPSSSSVHPKKSYSGQDPVAPSRSREAPYDPKYDPHYMAKADPKPPAKDLPRDPLDLYAQIKDAWIRDSYQGRSISPAKAAYDREMAARAATSSVVGSVPYLPMSKPQQSSRDPSPQQPQQRPPSPKSRIMYHHIPPTDNRQGGPSPREIDPRYYNPSPEQLRMSRVIHEPFRHEAENKQPHVMYDSKGMPLQQGQTYLKHPGTPNIHPPIPGRPYEIIPQHSGSTLPSHSRSPVPVPTSSSGRAMMNPPTNWPQPSTHPNSRSQPSPHAQNVSPHILQTPPSPVPMFVHPSPKHSPSPSPTGRPPVGQSPTHYRNTSLSPSMAPHQSYAGSSMQPKAMYFPPDDRYGDSKGKVKKLEPMYGKDQRDPRDSPRYNIIPSPTSNYPSTMPSRPGSYDLPDKHPHDYQDSARHQMPPLRPEDKYQHRYESQPELTVKYSSNENLANVQSKGDPMHSQQGHYDSYLVKYPSYEANLNYGPVPPKMNQPDFRRSDSDISRVSMETSRSRPMETIARVEISKHLPEPGPYDRQRHENQKMHPQANESYKIQLDISAAIKHETNRHGMESHRPTYTTYHHSIPSNSGKSETVLRISEPVSQRSYPEQMHPSQPAARSISPKRYDVTISKVSLPKLALLKR